MRPAFASKKYGCIVSSNGHTERMHWLKLYVRTTHTGTQSGYEDWGGMCRPQCVLSLWYDPLSSSSLRGAHQQTRLPVKYDSPSPSFSIPARKNWRGNCHCVSAARWEQHMGIRAASWRRQDDFFHLQCQLLLLRSIHWVVSMVQTENSCFPTAQGKWRACARSCGGLPQATRKNISRSFSTQT